MCIGQHHSFFFFHNLSGVNRLEKDRKKRVARSVIDRHCGNGQLHGQVSLFFGQYMISIHVHLTWPFASGHHFPEQGARVWVFVVWTIVDLGLDTGCLGI